MSSGLYSGVSGLALGVGLYKGVSGLWGGASGLIDGFGGSFSPASLFALSEPGAWYDPSDLTTLFQDSAGTTPVTTPGQSVGLMLDKSQGLVLGPELVPDFSFDNPAAWLPQDANWVVSGGKATYADGGLSYLQSTAGIAITAGQWYVCRFTISGATPNSVAAILSMFNATASINYWGAYQTFIDNGQYTVYFQAAANSTGIRLYGNNGSFAGWSLDSFSVKVVLGNHAFQSNAAQRPTYGIVPAGGRRNLLLNTTTLSTQSVTVAAGSHTLSFTGTGTVTLTGAAIGALVGTGVSDRVSLTFTATAGSLTLTVTGSVTLAQLEVGSTATDYQRVTTGFDVTEAGVASMSYVSFDGTDDGMLTGNIVPGTDKAQVFAGLRKLSDAARGTVVELSASAAANNGALQMTAPNAASSTFAFESKGTVLIDAVATGLAAPTTRVMTGLADIAGDSAIIRQNGTVADTDTGDQGTGNYLTYPLYIGRRGGSSLPLNGQLFSLIVRFGANLSAATISQTETWLGARVAPTVVIP
jgi:hypothetical protein